MELLFGCQREVKNNVNGHPVKVLKCHPEDVSSLEKRSHPQESMSAKKRAANCATKTRVPLAKAQSSFASALDEIDSEEDERRRQSCHTLPRKLTFGQCESQVTTEIPLIL